MLQQCTLLPLQIRKYSMIFMLFIFPTDDAEIRIRLDTLEEETRNLKVANAILLQIIQENLPHLQELFKKNNLGNLERVASGSVYLFIQISQHKELENLWKMYENGELKDEIAKILHSGTSQAAAGNIQVYIHHEEYLRVKEAFEQQGTMFMFGAAGITTTKICDAHLL